MAQASPAPAALSLAGLSKVFQGQWALRDVDLELRPAEVHALLGQNGSGKSTLIKILAGYHHPEPGVRAMRNGAPFDLGSSSAAHDVGLRFIHQDLAVIGELDVTDNLALGHRYTGRWWISDRGERAAARRAFAEYGVEVDVSLPLARLGVAQRTMTAIVRALRHGDPGGILVLDEPTASLSVQESAALFALIRRVRALGTTVLYVTHRLQEVFEIADRVTVLRDGRRVDTRPIAELNHDALVEMIIGRPLEALYPEPPTPRDDVVLEIDGLSGSGVLDASLRLHQGEIVGVTGLMGSGTDELLHLIYGSRPRTRGTISIAGRPYEGHSPHAAVAAGMGFAPADRKSLSGIGSWSLRENITLPRLTPFRWMRWLSPRAETGDVRGWLNRLGIVPATPDATFSSLSGGNQQKAVLARWLRCRARILLLEEPTAGVDVGAKGAIYRALTSAARDGAAVLIASTDVEEVAMLCDRVLVMRDGRIATVLAGASCTLDRVLSETVRSDAPPVMEREVSQ